ncbi:MAG TPA: L-threonylcarbamoyladenylate synthase [Paludibacter sp.]|nr:L-threonylcarbamoyladenylate synthase [Paludibacter sp.]
MIVTGTDIEFAAKCIVEGNLVAFPTETVYGLGADAFNPLAVARIFEVKQRPTFDPLIVHISEMKQINDLYDSNIDNLVYALAHAFWPGPLTIVHPKSARVPDIVTAGLNTVAVRMPSHPIALQLIRLSGTPIAAPSANRFGLLSPTRPEHVQKQLTNVAYLLENESEMVGVESTVVSIQNGKCILLRPGAISLTDIQKVIPCTAISKDNSNDKIHAPGLLKSHYSPNKPLYILSGDVNNLPLNSGLILHDELKTNTNANRVFCTSETQNAIEIAANLFIALHAMEDDTSVSQIFIESVEETGLGVAIMDRIRKASYRYKLN